MLAKSEARAFAVTVRGRRRKDRNESTFGGSDRRCLRRQTSLALQHNTEGSVAPARMSE
jgi:hypothetical protein